MQRPANLRILKVMCGGRVDPKFILLALKEGVDGVLIGHCHAGDCHYVEGNYKTLRKIPLLKKMIGQFGINPRRVKYELISASEGVILTEVVKEFVEELKELGPNPLAMEKISP